MNHVLVDFENVHHVDPSVFGDRPVSFTLMLGPKQAKLDAAMLDKLMARAASVQLVRIESSGKNAVDFALAYYLGRAVLADPTAHFHVISKDKGYDPLIEHLRARHVKVRRHDDSSTISFANPAKPEAPAAKKEPAPAAAVAKSIEPIPGSLEHVVGWVLQVLRKSPKNRPKKKTTLLSHLTKLLKDAHAGVDAAAVLGKLQSKHLVTIDAKEAVTYDLGR